MSEKPYPIAASKMPKGAKRGLGLTAVYKGWLWTFQSRPSNFTKTRGGVFYPVQELPCGGYEK